MFISNDYNELIALHRALIEAKFRINPNDELIAGSPIIADLSNRIVKELIELELKKNDDAESKWMKWLSINKCDNPFEKYDDVSNINILSLTPWEIALINAKKDIRWNISTYQEKEQMVKNYLSPFICTDSQVEEFINIIMSQISND